ncbi:hypothetical protein ACH5RR_013549 [Cinchona calisaya]|uniref:PGG domain-containing protein n=1 Tax=Cinchona calisaya TaxID=153742 RepID=A0ABD3A0F5_9GENT
MADQNTRTNYWQLLNRRSMGSFSEQFNAAFINLFNISYYFFQLEPPAVIYPDATTFVFTMTAILGLLQLKCQGKDSKNPFESHPIMIALAITSFLLYGLAYSIQLGLSPNRRYPTCARNVVYCSLLFTGSLCLAATTSFLFPDSVSPVIFVIYFIRSAAELLYWVYQRLGEELRISHEGRRRREQNFTSIWLLGTQRFTNPRPILPL